MVEVNIQNIEEIIFNDSNLWKKLPDLRHIRDQWKLSQMSPVLKAMGQKAKLDFLNSSKPIHEDIISKHLGTSVTISKIDKNVVKSVELKLEDAELDLNLESENLYPYFATYLKENELKITFWR